VPARCSMIYGQYPHHTGCYENGRMPQDDRESFMGALTRAGYRTHGIGKCHFTPDRLALRGFESRETQEEIVPSPDEDDYLTHLHEQGFSHVCDPHGIRGEMYYVPQPAQMPAELHPTQWVGDRAVAFIKEQGGKQPWFLYAGFIHPHPPFAPPNPWHKLYRAFDMPLPNVPADWESLLTYVNQRQNRYKYRDQGIDQNLVRCLKAYYYACISFIDFQVGRILDALETTDQLDNTLIICTSDHGELLGDYNSFGKRSMHDASVRVPMLIRQPGRFAPGAVCTRPVSLVDVAPTVLAAASTELATHPADGVDMANVATGRTDRTLVFAQHARLGEATYMAVSEEWKYVYSAADGRDFLFDRVRDPLETRNKAGGPLTKEIEASMKRALIDHLMRGGETGGIDGDDWRAFPRLEMPTNPDAGLLVQDHPWADTQIEGYT